MVENLKVAFIQSDIIWEDAEKNHKKLEKLINEAEAADLIILPEMFNSGFTMNTYKAAQLMNGETIAWMKNISLENNTATMGSIIISENGFSYNRLLMSYPCKNLKWYDKRHLFRMGNEHEVFTAGTEQIVFDYVGWRIKPLICYDLRFPVWSRNINHYDLLVYVANWPASRSDVWTTLLKARAIENQCFVIGVNRTGTDGNGISYSGNSLIIDFKGQVIAELPENEEGIGIANLSLSQLNEFRKKFPAYLDADSFEIKGVKKPE